MKLILAETIVVAWAILVIATGVMWLKEQIVCDPADGRWRFRTPEETATTLRIRLSAPQAGSLKPH